MTREHDKHEWRYITTASLFLRALETGYICTPSLLSEESNTPPDSELPDWVSLVRNESISHAAQKIDNPQSNIGFPISIIWDKQILSALNIGLPDDSSIVRLQVALPLADTKFEVGFASETNKKYLLDWMDDPTHIALKPLVENGFVDSSLVSIDNVHPVVDDATCPPTISKPESSRVQQLIREERLQCATEMALKVSKTLEQFEFVKGLIDSRWTAGQMHTILDLRWGRTSGINSIERIICDCVLQMDIRLVSSPLTIVEKSDLLTAIINQVGNDAHNADLNTLIQVRDIVRSDDTFSSLDINSLPPIIQGLIIFLNNNSSLPRVAQLDADFFGATDKIVISICAFLSGLRFRRTMMHSNLSWPTLRHLHIIRATAEFNLWPIDLDEHTVAAFDDHLNLDGNDYFPEEDLFVLDLPQDMIVHSRTKHGNEIYSHVQSIAFKTRRTLKSPKYVQIFRPKHSAHIAILNGFYFTKKKGKLLAIRFSNSALNDIDMESRIAIQFKIQGTAYIMKQDGSNHPIMNGDLILWPKTGKKMTIDESGMSQKDVTRYDKSPVDQLGLDLPNRNPEPKSPSAAKKLKAADIHNMMKTRRMSLRISTGGTCKPKDN